MVLEVDEETKEALREALSDMVNPVECLVFISDNPEECDFCRETVELCKLLEETSNGKVVVKVFNINRDREYFLKYNVDRVPSVLLLDGRIRYTGIPAGEEIKGLVETIVRISVNESGLLDSTVESLRRNLKGKAYVEVIVTPTCPYCPYAAVLANMFAFMGEGKLIADIVEAIENPDIADEYGVTAVPTVVVNGHVEFVGVPQEEDLLVAVLKLQQDEVPIPFHKNHNHKPPKHIHVKEYKSAG